jgi:hypothetical protein
VFHLPRFTAWTSTIVPFIGTGPRCAVPFYNSLPASIDKTAVRTLMSAKPSVESLDDDVPEKRIPSSPPDSSESHNQSHGPSHESTPSPSYGRSSSDFPFRRIRRLSATPSAPDERRVSGREPFHEKSSISLSSLSDYNGSEASHTERRFRRHWEELDSHSTGLSVTPH